jgi:NADPH:quinone reductase-like Zn-dependent oxidoreductase
VESVGRNHTEFKPGDEVFGEIPGYHGGLAEYVCTHGKTMMQKPASLTFEQAAAIPQAGVIALQGIRDKGQVRPGQKVLINGAGGSAGSFAIQLARLYGAEVTGVDTQGSWTSCARSVQTTLSITIRRTSPRAEDSTI